MADVAKTAGVSTATVSHVINGTRYVSPEVAERVRDAIEATGYRRHHLARALRRDRSDLVGLVVSDTGHPIFAEMVQGIEERARELNLTLLLSNAGEDPKRETELIDTLREHRADGMVLVPASGSDHQMIQDLVSEGYPLVILDRLIPIDVDQVGVESSEPLRQLVRHLVDLGHRRIALVPGTLQTAINHERLGACIDQLEKLGIGADSYTVIEETGLEAVKHPVEAAAEAVAGFLRHGSASAFVTLNAHQTVGTITALREANLEIPGDAALVAFDELPWPSLSSPGITCVAQPAAAMGRRAMDMLAARIEEPTRPYETVRLDCQIVHRGSCGCTT